MWKEKVIEILNQFNRGIIAVGFKNFSGGEEFYYREEEIFPAASIIKIPIMVAFFRESERGLLNPYQRVSLEEKDIAGGAGILFELHRGIELTLMDLVRLMIVISDNTATNILLNLTGFEKINALLKENGLKSSCIRRKMMVPSYKPEEENLITVKDITLFMEKLEKGELLSDEFTKEALDILKRQQYREKIPLYLPPDLEIAHKTGELSGVRHDVALVHLSERKYILSVLTKDLEKDLEGDRVIAEISKVVYDGLIL